jgi:hypothetical protein
MRPYGKPKGRKVRKTSEKIRIFLNLFSGLTNVYGTYDPVSGHAWQVKEPVTNDTILTHLKGKRPYGVYLLNGDRLTAIAADFDNSDPFPPVEFINSAQHYGLPAYIETSKSKGFHVWIFFNKNGVKAFKARMVVKHILEEIEYPQTEIFPKQNFLNNRASYGNFINAPLFGCLVPLGKTVFIEPHTLKPYPDQWSFLETVECIDEKVLDDIIELNGLSFSQTPSTPLQRNSENGGWNRFGLPICAQKMIQNGVSQYQRVSCFRLAVHLKRLGLPYDVAVAALKIWSLKNLPKYGKQVIAEHEIIDQTSYAYKNCYVGYGCNSPAVESFCDPLCQLKQKRESRK